MNEPTVLVQCPYCKREGLTVTVLRNHLCSQYQWRPIPKQDWFETVDKARVAKGLPEMVYGYEVEYEKHGGETLMFHISTSSAKAARRAALLKANSKVVTRVTPYTYAHYCRAFGVPGSKM
jgi:hypothetical protein